MDDTGLWILIIFIGFMYLLPYWFPLLLIYAAENSIEKSPEQKEKEEYEAMDELGKLIFEMDTPYWHGIRPYVPGEMEDATKRINEVIKELEKRGDVRAVRPLINHAEKRFLGEDGMGVWPYSDYSLAVKALSRFNDQESLDYLIKILSDKDREIRREAAKALDKRGWEPE